MEQKIWVNVALDNGNHICGWWYADDEKAHAAFERACEINKFVEIFALPEECSPACLGDKPIGQPCRTIVNTSHIEYYWYVQ